MSTTWSDAALARTLGTNDLDIIQLWQEMIEDVNADVVLSHHGEHGVQTDDDGNIVLHLVDADAEVARLTRTYLGPTILRDGGHDADAAEVERLLMTYGQRR